MRRFLPVLLCAAFAAPAAAQDAAPTLKEANTLLQSQDYAGAAKAFRAITDAQPSNAQAWYLLGYSLHAAGRLDEAIAANAKAAQDPKLTASAHYNTACAYSLKGDVEAAFQWLKKAQAAGYTNYSQVRTDSDLANLHSDPRFAQYAPDFSKPFAESDVEILQVWDGEGANHQFGWVAGSAGDLDADGVNDVVVGAPYVPKGAVTAGVAYMYSGKTGELLFKKMGQPGEFLGWEVQEAGDWNQDGHGDVAVGAPTLRNGPGAAYVYSGKDGSVLFSAKGENKDDRFGEALWGGGDLNGDGFVDLVVGSPQADAQGKDSGRIYVYSGKTGKLLHSQDGEKAGDNFGTSIAGWADSKHNMLSVGALNAGATNTGRVYVYRDGAKKPTLTLEAESNGKNYGRYFLSIPGDVDGDGTPDVYSIDFEGNNGSGTAYIHSGKDGSRIHRWPGTKQEGMGIGNAIAGDCNNDGHADVIVGAWTNSEYGPSAGKCYLFSGKDGSVLRTFTSTIGGETLGFDSTGIGDVNGDGHRDFLLTSAWSSVNGVKSGRVYIVSGAPAAAAGTR